MKKRILMLIAVGLLIASNLFAANGDLIVDGNVGIGTSSPNQKLSVNGNIEIARQAFNGIYFGNTPALIWRAFGGGSPAINSDSFAIGTDGDISVLMWDTFRDGAWAYCEGITGAGALVNCSDYSSLMTANDYFWVFKHGSDSRYPETADIKLLFDGESNDGVMGFMEDEDYFYFDDDVIFNGYIGIGTDSPIHPLEMASGAHVTAGGVWTDASSRDYKENISDLSTDKAIETLTRLNPVEFNYKVDKEEKYVGFIAEDVPDMVAMKDRKGLSPMDIVAVLTSVVKDQQKTIEELKSKVQKLEAKDIVANARNERY